MKVTDNVYALDSTKGSYVYVIWDKEIVLIDTGFSWVGNQIVKELKSMNIELKDIKHILLTHHDLDHIGNLVMLQRLTGAKVWAAKEDIPYIKGYQKRPGIKRVFSIVFKVARPEVIQAYDEEQQIDDIEIIPAPGHTPGHVCMLYHDVLFAGDLVETKKGKLHSYPNLNWNHELLIESIRKIERIRFRWVCPAHGSPLERETQWEKL